MGRDIVSAVKAGFLNIAHRGARSLAPENTLAAARKAMSVGAHMWELDVRLSRDGHLVVVHDETLDRTSDVRTRFPDRKPWRVNDFSLDELKAMDFGSWFIAGDPFGQIKEGGVGAAELEHYRGERIPSLEEALLFTIRNDWLVNIEIKDLSGLPGHDEIAEKTASVIAALEARERVVVSSFNHDYLARVKRTDKLIATAPLVDKPPADPVKLMRDLGATTYHPAIRALRPGHIQRLTAQGFGTLVWTVNSAKIARMLLRNGAAGIFSDFPQKLNETVESERRLIDQC